MLSKISIADLEPRGTRIGLALNHMIWFSPARRVALIPQSRIQYKRIDSSRNKASRITFAS